MEKEIQKHSVSDIQTMAKIAVSSNLFGITNEAQATALMLLCQAKGLHPMIACQKYHIIQGKPAMKADAMLADYQRSGGKIQWLERSDNECKAEFSHPAGGKLTVSWTLERAKNAALLGKDNWKKFPQQMLSARVISEGIRATAPVISEGIYTPEEVADFSEKDITPEIKENGDMLKKLNDTLSQHIGDLKKLSEIKNRWNIAYNENRISEDDYQKGCVAIDELIFVAQEAVNENNQ
jgi:hypothetical protein